MLTFDDIYRFFKGSWSSGPRPSHGGNAVSASSSPSANASASAAQGAARIFATRQSDESRVAIGSFGSDGQAPQHREELKHEGNEMKVVQTEFKIPTCTGELVKAKQICVTCFYCQGFDSVVTHCSCGVALCRRCVRRHPADGSPLCPRCHIIAVDNFNTWAARDRQAPKSDSV